MFAPIKKKQKTEREIKLPPVINNIIDDYLKTITKGIYICTGGCFQIIDHDGHVQFCCGLSIHGLTSLTTATYNTGWSFNNDEIDTHFNDEGKERINNCLKKILDEHTHL